MDNGVARPRAETPALPGGEAIGKRKRKPHDPNAPKRALTSYFLFMQDHKPQIKEANPDWTAAQISAESEKRWENITEEEKNVSSPLIALTMCHIYKRVSTQDYEVRYQVDLCRYYEQKKAYEAGEPIPDISAAEARKLYEEQLKSGLPPKGRKIGKAPTPAAPAPVQDTAEEEDSSEEEEESPEPQKAVTPPKTDRSSKRQKTAKDNAASSKTTTTKGKASPDSPKADRVSTSPELERKKKGTSKKKESKVDDAVEEEAEATVASPVKAKAADKKDKKSKRKRKSEAVDED